MLPLGRWTPLTPPAGLACGCCAVLPPQIREKTIADQFEARRAKNKATRERKAARREERIASVSAPEACRGRLLRVLMR